jgi:hypothetical protein
VDISNLVLKFVPADKLAGMVPINAVKVTLVARQAATATAHAGLLAHECATAVETAIREKRDLTADEIDALIKRMDGLRAHAIAAFSAMPDIDVSALIAMFKGVGQG